MEKFKCVTDELDLKSYIIFSMFLAGVSLFLVKGVMVTLLYLTKIIKYRYLMVVYVLINV